MQTVPGRVHVTLSEQETLGAAIMSGGPAGATAALRHHLESAMQNFVAFPALCASISTLNLPAA